MEDEEDDGPRAARRWLEDLSNGAISQGVDHLSLQGLKVVQAKKGLILCHFTIPNNVADKDGNWHVGAIAILVDDVGAAAIHSSVGHLKGSVNFSISYHSTVKILEEVVIEAKFVGKQGNLASVLVEVTRKDNGEMVALGKQWMLKTSIIPTTYQNKNNSPSQGSKL